MHTLIIDGQKFSIPARWEELTNAQYLHLMEAFLLPDDDPMQLAEAVCAILNLPDNPDLGDLVYRMSPDDIAECLFFAGRWFLENKPTDTNRFPYLVLPKSIAETQCELEFFSGAGEDFECVTYNEFIYILNYLQQIEAGKKEKFVELLALLYRPYRPSDKKDQREEFAEHKIKKNAEHFRFISEGMANAIILGLYGAMKYWQRAFPKVFKGGSTGKPDPMVWMKVLRQASPSVADMKRVGEVELPLMLFDLSERIREADELKKQQAQYDNRS